MVSNESNGFDQADVQGWVLRGYHRERVRHVVLRVKNRERARQWIGATVSGDERAAPQIQTAVPWDEKPPTMFNIAFTADGLEALGIDTEAAGFPEAFREGMAARHIKIGDVGESAPDRWIDAYRPPEKGGRSSVHVVATIHADHEHEAELRAVNARIPSDAFEELHSHDGVALRKDRVHFGYRDGISQPRFEEVPQKECSPDRQPFAPLGVALLGYATPFETLRWRVPTDVGHNGSFNAFRILRQLTSEFDQYLEDAAEQLKAHPAVGALFPDGWEGHWPDGTTTDEALPQIVAAKLLGRWQNGNSLETDPIGPGDEFRPPCERSDFDYDDDYEGERCPIGSHVRRNNPRGATIVQRYANHTRRIIRRGMPYGPPDGSGESGLLGNFIGASLSAQFEALQNDWMNVGLLDPRVTGTNDPILGANDEMYSRFTFPVGDDIVTLRGFPRFVITRGGAYTFIPGIAALRKIGEM